MKTNPYLLKSQDIEAMEGEKRTHFLNPNAVRKRKAIGDLVGLQNIGVHIVTIEPGKESTEHHKHYHEEECIYVLSGKGTLFLDRDSFPIGQGDFMGFPVNTVAHSIKNDGTEPLTLLVMGQRLAQDTADYPNQRKRLYRDGERWDIVAFQHIEDPRNTNH